MMKIALHSGLRRGEIFRLTWDDIDFTHGFIYLRNPKGGEDQRVPLNAETRKVIQAQIHDGPYIFPGMQGRQRVEARRGLNRIKELAGLPEKFRPLHGLRHTFASLQASAGVDLYHLQKLLTHHDPTMTQRYAHLADRTLRQASAQIGKTIKEIQSEKKRKKGPGRG